MKREHALLVQGAFVISYDLARTLGSGWYCEVSEDERLHVTNTGLLTVDVPIETDVDPEEALPDGALDSEWRDVELAADALAAVSDAVQGVLDTVVGQWPMCVSHHRMLTVCSGLWVCGQGHDIAVVGELPVGEST